MLEKIKIELGIAETDTSMDALLNRYIEKATAKITQFTKQTKEYVEANLSESVIDYVIIMYNTKGTHGLKSQSYSGVSETYTDDIPMSLKRDMYSHRRLYK